MELYFAGEPGAALEGLRGWIASGARGPDSWRARASRVLETIADTEPESSLALGARSLQDELKQS